MRITSIIEKEYRQRQNFGVTFGIDADDYNDVEGHDVQFGKNHIWGMFGQNNNQAIFIDKVCYGYLAERQEKNSFHPIKHSFKAILKDGIVINSPHFEEDEDNLMSFSNLKDFCEFVLNNKDKVSILDETLENKTK